AQRPILESFWVYLFILFVFLQEGVANVGITKPKLLEKNGKFIECYLFNELPLQDGSLKNWGENISFQPQYVFVPKTKEGICNIVQWAANDKQNLRIRVCGYRHTWNPIYPDSGQVLISLLGLEYVNSNLSPSDVDNETGAGEELKTIEFVSGSTELNKIFCKIGGAVTNDELRAFCLENTDPFQNSYWSIPLNVILVENTLSGTISSICHGAGSQHSTLSDLVEEIEFVNAKGKLQVINKTAQPELMQAAAGSFGLLGVITSITLKLDKMSYSLTSPRFVDLVKAIPPPFGTRLEQMPKNLQDELNISNQEMLDSIILENTETFFNCCKDYYAEWFWFILNKKCWINSWNLDTPVNNEKNRNDWVKGGGETYYNLLALLQEGMTGFAALFNSENLKMPPPPFQKYFVKGANHLITTFLSTGNRVLPLPDALHFQHGIRHMRVRDMEIEIPIPLKQDGQPDWTICQKAWWDAIDVIYRNLEETGTVPVNLTLEMRIMGGSEITMAAQRDNSYTCSIEVLSTMLVPHETWKTIAEKIITCWTSYTDAENKPLACRTHWAKEWHGLQFNGVDAEAFVKQSYQKVIPQFKEQLSEIAAAGGYTLNDIQNRFSNSLWDTIFFQP
ncbi:MAG TPA: hypothetical protein VLG76_04075, partial [Rhabdochlamydiaceae bacterium]|nr:hypothetical protein [Rhabdochlamydiaceae bacterium]